MIDPNTFIETVNNSMSTTYMLALTRSTKEWEVRNSGDTVSGSAVSKCIRLCYYRWFDKESRQVKDPVFTDKLDDKSIRNMYFGLLVEDILINALKTNGIPGGGIIHSDQTKPPVVLTDTVSGITRSAANDMVVEGLDEDGQFFIPTECKTSDRQFSYKDKVTKEWMTPQKWWDSFTGYDEHKRQVMQWIWLAKKNDMRVPFGCLFYLRRGTWETKFIIIDTDSMYWDRSLKADQVIDYGVYAPEIDHRNEQLVTSITMDIEPEYDSLIPKFVCEGCNYYERCKATR